MPLLPTRSTSRHSVSGDVRHPSLTATPDANRAPLRSFATWLHSHGKRASDEPRCPAFHVKRRARSDRPDTVSRTIASSCSRERDLPLPTGAVVVNAAPNTRGSMFSNARPMQACIRRPRCGSCTSVAQTQGAGRRSTFQTWCAPRRVSPRHRAVSTAVFHVKHARYFARRTRLHSGGAARSCWRCDAASRTHPTRCIRRTSHRTEPRQRPGAPGRAGATPRIGGRSIRQEPSATGPTR